MEQIDGFMFFRSYYEAIRQLPDPEEQAALYDAVCAYAFLDEEPQFTGISQAMWNLILPSLARSVKRASNAKKRKIQYKNETKIRKKSGEKRREKMTEEEEEAEEEVEVEVEEKEKKEKKVDKEGEGESTSGDGPPPLLTPSYEQIQDYCHEQGLTVDPKRFFNYYEACGWMLHGGPMVNWRACLESWERNDLQKYSKTARVQRQSMTWEPYTPGEDELRAIKKLEAMAKNS